MSMNFYIEILSPRVPPALREGKIKEEICGAIMTFAAATREMANLFVHFVPFEIDFLFKALSTFQHPFCFSSSDFYLI